MVRVRVGCSEVDDRYSQTVAKSSGVFSSNPRSSESNL